MEAHYPRAQYELPETAWAAIYIDRMFACPQLVVTLALAGRAPIFAHKFASSDAPGLLHFFPGVASDAYHTGELPFLFDIENKPIDITGKSVPLTEAQQALGTVMIG